MSKIAALYARVSTQRQENEETIETQIYAVKKYAQDNGFSIVKEYRDDGWSGTLLARPALDELRIEAKKKLWESVLVYDPDRIARKYAYQALVTDELEEMGIKVLFVTIPPAKTDEDRLLYGVKGLFAEYERARNAERFRLGKIRKAMEGNIVHGDAPYGYTYVYQTKKEDCHYIVNENEAKIVKMIFTWIATEGLTVNKIIKRLFEMEIPPRKAKRSVWTNGPLSRMVRNEAYIGKAYYNKGYGVIPKKPVNTEKYKRIRKSSRALRPKREWIEIQIPRIMDDELFYKVQRQLDINAQFARRNKKHDYLLSRLIWCACGSRMFGEGSNDQFYYRCTDRLKSYPLPKKCQSGGLNILRIEGVAWFKLQELLTNPDLVKKQAEKWYANDSQPSTTSILERERLQKALEEAKAQESRYTKVYGEGLISIEVFRKNMNEVKKKQNLIHNQLNKLPGEERASEHQMIPVEQLQKRLPEILNYLNTQEKQTIIRKLIKEIIVNQERTSATIRGCIPLQVVQDSQENPKCGYESISRNRRTSKRRKINAL